MSHKYDTRKVYFENHDEMNLFTLSPEDPIEIRRYYTDRKKRKCIHVPEWKLARFESVRVDEDGRVVSPKRSPKQTELF